ncbi:MAG: hypothetical protein GWN01_12410, partial [Nitrosopumilaceae archaeon]|nr:hypothetical protein [Nitrosopumilaceae archaeon]NIU88091.1 hypothetical protein [Nitrosopumilaceae archaeon]NIV66340.1 hypothetical protein [Nitrosopumilaceae archaeon]NIX62279.1 hypothetical protein [Nitrosopumilaceae archaeon]
NKLDQKLKFIDLANTVAHDNTVLIPKTMGVVAVTEQAIINEAHSLGFVIPDKNRSENEDIQAAGAYVAYPKKGLHKWIGSLDINSLYPSTFQALNMSPETIVGQLRPDETNAYIREKMRDKPDASGKIKKGMSFGDAWEGLFGTLEYTAVMERREDVKITIDWEPKTNNNFSTFATLSHNKTEATAKEVYELIFESNENLILSANGTIFTCEKEGIIP